MKGNLGKVSNRLIRGWAFDPKKAAPIRLSIYLDGEKVQDIDADQARKDVVASHPKAPLHCGFEYKFSENTDLSQFKMLRVVYTGSDIDVAGSPFRLDRLDSSKKGMVDIDDFQVENFFLHIPKTAGTSFRIELLHYFGEQGIFPNSEDLVSNNDQYPPSKKLIDSIPSDRIDDIKVISGHYRFKFIKNIFPESNTMVFFREPISRAISNLKHLQRHSKFYQGQSLIDIATHGKNVNIEIDNRQARMIWQGFQRKNLTFEKVKKVISKFDFIGITELYKPSIELCNKTFNWDLKGDIFANKAEDTTQDEEVSDDLIEFIENNNQVDLLLYEYALELFKERCEVKGVKF